MLFERTSINGKGFEQGCGRKYMIIKDRDRIRLLKYVSCSFLDLLLCSGDTSWVWVCQRRLHGQQYSLPSEHPTAPTYIHSGRSFSPLCGRSAKLARRAPGSYLILSIIALSVRSSEVLANQSYCQWGL